MFEEQTYETIKQRTLDNIALPLRKNEGSILDTFAGANAMSLAKCYIDMGDTVSIGFIETSFGDFLDKRVKEFGVYRKLGKKANGKIKVKGKAGAVLTNGTVFLCDNLGFVMLNDVEIGVSDDICYVEALGVGKEYNLLPSQTFKLKTQIEGFESATNEEAFKGGIDIETDDELKDRFQKVVSNPSTSGNKYHYEEWALEVDGVGKAYVYPLWAGNGTIKVMIVSNDNKPVDESIVEAAKYHIEENMPIGCRLTVTTPAELAINISANVELLNGYTVEDVKEAFNDKLLEYLKNVDNEVVYTKVLGILAGILGVDDFSALTINGGTNNITVSVDRVPAIGTINFVEVV